MLLTKILPSEQAILPWKFDFKLTLFGMKVEEKKLTTIYSLCIFWVLSSDIAPTVCQHFCDICREKLHLCQQVATACYVSGLAKINLLS
jgi:hypothetical protein